MGIGSMTYAATEHILLAATALGLLLDRNGKEGYNSNAGDEGVVGRLDLPKKQISKEVVK